jgi:hypothetical protein
VLSIVEHGSEKTSHVSSTFSVPGGVNKPLPHCAPRHTVASSSPVRDWSSNTLAARWGHVALAN